MKHSGHSNDRGERTSAEKSRALTSDPQGSALNHLNLDFTKTKKRRKRTIRLVALFSFLTFIVWFVPPVYRLMSGTVTVTRWDRKLGETRAVVGPGRPGWIKASAISRHVLHSFVAAEDGKFYYHSGFDVAEIAKSIKTNINRKRYARGASTISQQVVKMAFLSREKSLLRKAREAVGTVLMEALLPKEKILEWYINLAEFGDGVYGISEGCRHYFKTKPEQLTIEQSVHLALVLPSPNSWSRGLRDRNLTPFGHKRFASILNNMKLSGYITKSQWQTALSRGDFGRPINGYTRYIANEDKLSNDCTIEACGDTETDPFDELSDETQAIPSLKETEALASPLMSAKEEHSTTTLDSVSSKAETPNFKSSSQNSSDMQLPEVEQQKVELDIAAPSDPEEPAGPALPDPEKVNLVP